MTNEAIPNLTAFDDTALDKAFAALEAQARESAAGLDSEAMLASAAEDIAGWALADDSA